LVADEISLSDSEQDAFLPPGSSRVSTEDSDIPEFDLKSVLVPKEAMEKYKSGHACLKRELQLISLDDHIWSLKSFDVNSVGVVKLHCGECMKDIGGSSGDHNKSTIHNLFANFKNSHIMANAHIRNWCWQKRILWTEHPQSIMTKGKTIVLISDDHRRAVEEGLQIMDGINKDICKDGGPFQAIGDPGALILKSFWYKVRYKVCGDIFQLCPPKKNLEANLSNHYMSIMHAMKLEEVEKAKNSKGSALSTGWRGRPSLSSRLMLGNQADLHSWFKSAATSVGASSDAACGAPDSSNTDSILGFLCWGFSQPRCLYAGRSYDIRGLLSDPMPRKNWVPKPSTKRSFEFGGISVAIHGCFRHKCCTRFSSSEEPFPNFSCMYCKTVPQESDFRMRVLREDASLQKRGS
jgi:hypothetical protein